jgi:hypothetical protein
VPSHGPGFAGTTWIEQTIAYTNAIRNGEGASTPRDAGLLALGAVGVLDFGGGLGVDYFYLRRILARPEAREPSRDGHRSRVAWYRQHGIQPLRDLGSTGSGQHPPS